MNPVWWLLIGYLLTAFPLGLFVALFIRAGRGPTPTPSSDTEVNES